MRVISRATLLELIGSYAGRIEHASIKGAIDVWFDEISKASWSSFDDVQRNYVRAIADDDGQIVFSIMSDACQVVVSIDFEKGIAWIIKTERRQIDDRVL